ncbi:holo-ACP synthase [Bacillus carboniphilus]|uniref:Holo-[acyl-carrier-protein] synthase n=1 Tax=Bacillus carboniphilus TaxID=86663 RepID=A0ABY9JRW2_9BACI|nr:holo-ACP synthase [Bacillus carboniphilus]WLR42145.1 holo-ACP synthase [Bacillus carboniphilus]
MIIGVGIDLVEITRIDELKNKSEKFVSRILTNNELSVYQTLSERRKNEFLAGRFAAKEAFSKAYGSGIGKEVQFHDLEIMNNNKGKPELIQTITQHRVHISISHSEQYAIAQVIIESLSS